MTELEHSQDVWIPSLTVENDSNRDVRPEESLLVEDDCSCEARLYGLFIPVAPKTTKYVRHDMQRALYTQFIR